MSRWPERSVRLAARLLPAHVRDRYREEWLADLEGARELGIPTSSIAVGALLFSATIDRSAPEISGVPLSVAARIHARRGIALVLSAGVLALGAYVGGSRSTDFDASFAGALVALLTALMIPVLAILAAVGGLVELWRAAFFASGLAKVCAALATIGVVSTPFAVLAGWFLVPVALVSLVGALIVGIVAWAGSSQPVHTAAAPDAPTTEVPARRRILPRWALILVLTIGGLITAALTVIPGIAMFVILAAVATTALVLAVRTIRSRASGSRRLAGAMAIAAMTVGLFLVVGLGALDMLVLSPQWMAPGYSLEEIYAALSPADLASGLIMAYVWIGFWALAALVYLAVALASIGRSTPSTHWMLVTGFAIIAAMVFFQFWASFSLGNSISDTLPPFRGGRHDVGVLFGIVGQFSLVFALWGAIAPRRQDAEVRRASGTGLAYSQ